MADAPGVAQAAPPPTPGPWPLTAALTRAVFDRLPLDARLRLRVVCRATRAALSDPALWEVLDATAFRDGHREQSRALRVASRLAAGGVRELTVSWRLWYRSDVMQPRPCCETLLHVVEANAKRLRVLRIVGADSTSDTWGTSTSLTPLKRLLTLATELEELHVDLKKGWGCEQATRRHRR